MVDEHFGINIVEYMVRILYVHLRLPSFVRYFGPFSPLSINLKVLTLTLPSLQAAGLIPITNASGGPYLDIAIPHPTSGLPTGFHCNTEEEYADAFWEVFRMDKGDEVEMRKRARGWAVQAFSEEQFVRSWDESGWMEWMEV
jgi:glycosyltransferase involved in cell wall biosynthesis